MEKGKFNHTLYKIVYLDKLPEYGMQELADRKEKDIESLLKKLNKEGAKNIKYFKQTKYKDANHNIIYVNDTIIRKNSGLSSGKGTMIEGTELIVMLENNEIYKYTKGWGNKGVELSLDHNSIDFNETIAIGNVELLRHDLSKLLDN